MNLFQSVYIIGYTMQTMFLYRQAYPLWYLTEVFEFHIDYAVDKARYTALKNYNIKKVITGKISSSS